MSYMKEEYLKQQENIQENIQEDNLCKRYQWAEDDDVIEFFDLCDKTGEK